MTIIKRNQIIVLALAVMIVAAGYLNYSYQEGGNPFAEEITGNIGGKLGEATFVDGQDEAGLGMAEPAGSIIGDRLAQTGTESVESADTVISSAEFFAETRLEKERVRDEEVAMHESLIKSSEVSKEIQDKAQAQLTAISQKWEKEMIIERLIKAKGFRDVIVFINDGSVNVVVSSSGKLTQAQAAQIQDIVMREAKIKPDNIKIVEK